MNDNGVFLFGDQIMDMNVAEAQREVQGYRLQRRARGMRARGSRVGCVALAKLGQRLVAWGSRLQERYDVESSSPTPAHSG